ncbi:MAG: AAA family ATPase, partial [Candidatus Woesearchaeota archaeon]
MDEITKVNRLVLHGFKSFAKRTEIAFTDRFNVVLGPNGSGKSNILDALTFVLGKSSSKALRAEKSANLIYNGGKKKDPAKQGEVSIFFDNSNMEFPSEEKEIKITRIITKSGQSKYKINDKSRTRQQIIDLMGIAKINPDGYNIILQGDITNFCNMTTASRREIIEEIAGISIYEEKKNKALRDLDKVETNIKEAEIV